MPDTLVRFTGTGDFPLQGGLVEFHDQEVGDVEIHPAQELTEVFSQERDLTIYENGPEHFEVSMIFIVDTWRTTQKLEALRQHRAPLLVFPSWLFESSFSIEMLWRNPNDFRTRLRKGYHQAGYTFTMRLREPLGDVCRPPGIAS